MAKYFFTSLTRISDLRDTEFLVEPIPREQWSGGDYIAGEVVERPSIISRLELSTGRTTEVMVGSFIVGALARREATLESNGDWRLIEEDMRLQTLGTGGSMGKLTSKSPYLPDPLTLVYRGHVLMDGKKRTMRDYVPQLASRPFNCPTVLVVGTSMSAGKTTAARSIIRELKGAGLRVCGAKLTGSGRYRDILSMRDAGADYIYDFVDVGLPTTVCDHDAYHTALQVLLTMIMARNLDVLVAEVGASVLEPYNGDVAVEEIKPHVRLTVLCAADAYGVVGFRNAYPSLRPDLVSGPTTNTQASINLVQRLSGLTALNMRDRASLWQLRDLLRERLAIPMHWAHPSVEYSGKGVGAQPARDDLVDESAP